MPRITHTQLVHYSVVILIVLSALALMLMLDPWLNMSRTPFLLFFGAVMVSAWYGGFKSGILATFLSILCSQYFFLPPVHTFYLPLPSVARVSFFGLQGVLVSILCEALRTAKQRAEWNLQKLIRNEEALRESEARFRAMFDQAVVGIAQVSLDGRFIQVNPALCHLTGYSREELTQMSFQEITHPDDLEADLEKAKQVLAKKICGYSLEKRYIRKDGALIWVNLTSSAVWDSFGKPKYALGVIEDISDRKQAESVKSFLLEASTILATSLDYEATLTKVVQLAVSMIADCCIVNIFQDDWTVERTVTASVNSVKDEILQELKRRYSLQVGGKNLLMQHLQQGKSVFLPEYTDFYNLKIAQDDEHLQLLRSLGIYSAMVIPLRSRGQIFGALFLLITESSHRYTSTDLALAEDIARRAAAAIDNARLYQETQQAKQTAEAANRVKDEFLAVLSHELRTPLNPILGWAKLLRSRKYNEATVERALETIERNAKLQTQLIEDLLDVSRILRGKVELNTSVVDLVPTIQAAIETIRLAAEAKFLDLQFLISDFCSCHEQKPIKISQFHVLGDSGRLQQVIWNLLSNAVKFTPAKGRVEVRLSISTPDLKCEPNSSDLVVIQVIDTGKGISPTFLPYVFDYFRQADATTTRKFGGLGLGLAIVKHLVELHGGTVEADSPGEGQGSTFTVRLPLLASSNFPILNSQASLLPNPHSLLLNVQILVVDDQADTREFFRFVLEQYGASVITTASGTEALQALAELQPDILLSDIGMPEMDGYMLLRQVRKLSSEKGGQIPAIALTAYAGEMDQSQAQAAGFQKHLAKPVDPNELVTTIAHLLGRC